MVRMASPGVKMMRSSGKFSHLLEISLCKVLTNIMSDDHQEGRVVIAGGSDGFHLRRETFSFQLASGSWMRGPDLHQPRSDL